MINQINRRKFMSLISCFGASAFLFKSVCYSSTSTHQKKLTNAITNVLKDQATLHDDFMQEGQIKNLNYAINKIAPANHQELAFSVACSMSAISAKPIIDEYVRRKKGGKPILPDHQILNLCAWCVPDTQRILIFKEQANALIKELSGKNGEWYSREVIMGVWGWKGNLNIQEFKDIIADNHRKQLNDNEIKIIYEAILYMKHFGYRSYTWCSAIVSKTQTQLQLV